MQAKPRDTQGELYSVRLDFLCNERHPVRSRTQYPKAPQSFLIVSFLANAQNTFSDGCGIKNTATLNSVS